MRSYTLLLPLALAAVLATGEEVSAQSPAPVTAPSLFRAPLGRLPELPEGVASLSFSDFFVRPVGEKGLTPTPRLLALNGRRVRIAGYMVRQEQPVKGILLLSPIPMQLHEEEYGLADELPPSTVWVTVPAQCDRLIAFQGGPLLLTGTLQVGNRDEADGRVSLVRLVLDDPAEPTPGKGR